ncbi:MAG: hypothetical protein R8J84_08460 [Mariprofundales bacterium]
MSAAPEGFFQCTHCEKKYAASAKARAAAGRSIRCKQCGETFTITIEEHRSSPRVASAAVAQPSHDGAESPKRSNRGGVKDKSPRPQNEASPSSTKKFRTGKRVAWGGILALLAAAGGGWWLFQQQQIPLLEPLDSVAQRDAKLPELDALPKDENAVQKEVGPALPDQATVADLVREPEPIDPASLNFRASSKCQETAAEQWLNDYTLAHTRYKQREFVRLLDQSSQLTARMHKACRNNILLRAVIGSAKSGKKPAWLLPQIDALMNPEYNEDAIVGDRGL